MARRSKQVAEEKEGKFTLKKLTSFESLRDGTTKEIPESDLTFQDDTHIYQLKYHPLEDEVKEQIKPGIYNLAEMNGRITLKKAELRTHNLLTSVVNAKAIINEADAFFNNLDVYKELEEPMVRKILIHSDPGMGKSSTITHYSSHAVKEDSGTVIVVWPTAEIEAHYVSRFLTKNSEYIKKCTRLILIMEDIGGGEREGNGAPRSVDSAMLDLLDGLQVTFKLPTFIIATTNYPQNLLSALADRPGRFDKILALKPPSYEERCKVAEFIAKKPLSEEDKKALKIQGAEEFSFAHIKEVIIRSRLHKKTLETVVRELIDHKKNFKNAFQKSENVLGFGSKDEIDF